jgi:transcription elongation factor Elf1
MGGNAIKIVIAVALFVTAGVLFTVLRPSEEAPALAEDVNMQDMVCAQCGHHFQMGYEELLQALKAAPPIERPPDESPSGGRTRTSGRRPTPISCPECNEVSSFRAAFCKDHNQYYPTQLADGSRGRCPEC